MYGYIEGFSETDDIRFCPKCGAEITEICNGQGSGTDLHPAQDVGTARCTACGFSFGVIEVIRAEKGE